MKLNLQKALNFCFHLKKLAAASLYLPPEAYGDHAISSSSCEYWFKWFKNGNFDLKDKIFRWQPKKFEDEKKWKPDKDQCQTVKE